MPEDKKEEKKDAKVEAKAETKAAPKAAAKEPEVEMLDEEIEAEAVAVVATDKPKTRTIVPRQSVGNVRIGQKWYMIEKDKKLEVPVEIIPHLTEKGIL